MPMQIFLLRSCLKQARPVSRREARKGAAVRARRGFTLIELLVVIGIAAMLLTMASTHFFGAMRRESITKSRNQLRDLLLTARQQACILGTTHLVICWNSDVEIQVGDRKTKARQGRYALFQYVGDVWQSGQKLYTPFGFQSEQFATLKHGARAVSLMDADASKFARITDVVRSPTKTEETIRNDISSDRTTSIEYVYTVGGQAGQEKWKPAMFPIASYTGTLKAVDASDKRVPLAIRTSSNYSLPQYYAFDKDRTVFIFTADGCLDSTGASAIAANFAAGGGSAKKLGFSLSVNADGTISFGNSN